ncbi:discoidin domain-containing protein [Marinifilum fragile]|uniref:discoidin domain-containing protein n=1 Tax=Marinifilum fragile TaxID=570161 RepID=UPI0006D28B6C|nr:discoidin domain-containing protein [Marinifilum fragile]
MKILYLSITVCCVFFMLSLVGGCAKEKAQEIEELLPEEVTYNYSSTAKYNLNVVYFLPADVEERKNSHYRLSQILLNGQAFYRNHMKEYGFGDKTFNMLVDQENDRVKIIYIQGKYPTANYPYEGGGAKVLEEVDEYFDANPDEKSSDHTLILLPVVDHDNPDVPYYGLGRNCLALDYTEMDIKYFGEDSKKGNDATKYIGGLLHELGHCLNLPHNKEKVSEASLGSKGTSLMGSGNYTYGKTPTFLTEASCAILNNCQVISDFENSFYTTASLSVSNILASYENGKLKISGTYNTNKDVNYVCFYCDPATDNADYDAVSWASPVKGDNTFDISMPISEFHQKGNTPYVLRLLFCHVNGEISKYSYSFTFQNDVPIIEFGDKNNFDRTNWKVIDFSSEENNELASYVLDGDAETFWHSRWSQNATSYPHHLTIDMGDIQNVSGFSFLQRDGMRKVQDIEILVSNDNIQWESMGNFQLKEINTLHHVNLSNETKFRYFKIIMNSAFDGQQFAALAEIMCF